MNLLTFIAIAFTFTFILFGLISIWINPANQIIISTDDGCKCKNMLKCPHCGKKIKLKYFVPGDTLYCHKCKNPYSVQKIIEVWNCKYYYTMTEEQYDKWLGLV